MTSQYSWEQQRIWIIGASRGIGAALAKDLAEAGALVAISARDETDLAEVSAGQMYVATADVTDRDSLHDAAANVRAHLGALDTVIYCSGYWKRMDSRRWDSDEYERHVAVNLLGMNSAIAAVLPEMVERGSGRFVGIASVAGYRGLPGAEAYGATKAAQINQLEAMRAALAPSGIDIVTVCPGFVRTQLTAGNRFPMPFIITAEKAAAAIRTGLARQRQEIVFPAPIAIGMKLARLLPVRAWTRLAKPKQRSTSGTPTTKE